MMRSTGVIPVWHATAMRVIDPRRISAHVHEKTLRHRREHGLGCIVAWVGRHSAYVHSDSHPGAHFVMVACGENEWRGWCSCDAYEVCWSILYLACAICDVEGAAIPAPASGREVSAAADRDRMGLPW
jgi:hypothetical protein